MFYDHSRSEEGGSSESTGREEISPGASGRRGMLPSSGGSVFSEEQPTSDEFSLSRRGYERELIQSVWEFAEAVSGNDPELWRKDEFGDWIYRFDYGRRSSEFGWEIFDPGVGRHAQGVYAMRPMQWQGYIRQYETLA